MRPERDPANVAKHEGFVSSTNVRFHLILYWTMTPCANLRKHDVEKHEVEDAYVEGVGSPIMNLPPHLDEHAFDRLAKDIVGAAKSAARRARCVNTACSAGR